MVSSSAQLDGCLWILVEAGLLQVCLRQRPLLELFFLQGLDIKLIVFQVSVWLLLSCLSGCCLRILSFPRWLQLGFWFRWRKPLWRGLTGWKQSYRSAHQAGVVFTRGTFLSRRLCLENWLWATDVASAVIVCFSWTWSLSLHFFLPLLLSELLPEHFSLLVKLLELTQLFLRIRLRLQAFLLLLPPYSRFVTSSSVSLIIATPVGLVLNINMILFTRQICVDLWLGHTLSLSALYLCCLFLLYGFILLLEIILSIIEEVVDLLEDLLTQSIDVFAL